MPCPGPTPQTICGTHLCLLLDTFAVVLGDYCIVTAQCPDGKERLRQQPRGRFPLSPTGFGWTVSKPPTNFFANQRDGVMKVAITPWASPQRQAGTPSHLE